MSSPRQPLRTALIGLSSSAVTSWAAGAHLPNLLTPAGKSKYAISALLNSSVDAAKAAIKVYDLPPSTKAYGSPEDLAKDPDIDVVICNTRVDKHYETILPSIRAGKDVYVEWPIASNLTHIDELVQAAKQSGSRVAVGLQGRWQPPLIKIREILHEQKLGKVLSVEVRAFGGTIGREILPSGLKYFADRKIGGNPITIGFAHLFDSVLSTVGDIDPGSVHTKLQLQRPDIRIRDPESGKIVETITSTVPDLLSLHGSLKKAPHTASAATLSLFFRRGGPFPGTPALTLSIALEKGEIRYVVPSGLALMSAKPDEPVTITIHNFDTDKTEDVPWEYTSEQKEVNDRAKGVLTCLYAFADGLDAATRNEEGERGWVSLEDAADRARLIESFLKRWEESGAQ
ncbi:putative oxidoreductase [Lophiostoma macrostomum CBS 122681]|uniref:Putative oxidoreductase n=1 Tax=Lophiostoma macrostomum CBS 122681 TaxID=1314788 RepID=A0A6A6SWB9_9PLEO|nr:putative oxidoreductase [Lophiostoma macrostomum CBS 122681]